MSRNTIIGIVVAIIVILLIWWWWAGANDAGVETIEPEVQTEEVEPVQ